MNIEVQQNVNPLDALQDDDDQCIQAPKRKYNKTKSDVKVIEIDLSDDTYKDVIEPTKVVESVVEPLKIDEIVVSKRKYKKKIIDPNAPIKPKRVMTAHQLENLKNGRAKGKDAITKRNNEINERKTVLKTTALQHIETLKQKQQKDSEDLVIKEAIKIKKKQLEQEKALKEIADVAVKPVHQPPKQPIQQPIQQPQKQPIQQNTFNGYAVNFI